MLNVLLKEKIISWAVNYGYIIEDTEDEGYLIDMPKIAHFLPQILPMQTSIYLRDIYTFICSIASLNCPLEIDEHEFNDTLMYSLQDSGNSFIRCPICIDFLLQIGEGTAEDFPVERMGTYIYIYEETNAPDIEGYPNARIHPN
jgi:hypothetical protein